MTTARVRSPDDGAEPTRRTDRSPGRVVVAMSGGVDSSVVAALMFADGWDVVGVSMRLYGDAKKAGKSCCSPDDLIDAREVATAAGLPFYVANYQEEFQRRVVDYFVDEYRRGRTPSPCILCNDHLKFDVLLDRMLALGGDVLATGHYARIERVGDGTPGGGDARWALMRGVDSAKDQSYFLFGLARDSLARIRFPLGGMDKEQVRALGRELGVPTADKRESQDICFVGGGRYADFVEERLDPALRKPGRFVRAGSGEVLGEHDGIHRFTVGQRRGMRIAHAEPLYVKAIDAATGDVTVGTRAEIAEKVFSVSRCNWLRWDAPPRAFRASVQVRYRHRAVPCAVVVGPDGTATVELDRAEAGISPGQAAVLYDGDEVLGGGWIESVGVPR